MTDFAKEIKDRRILPALGVYIGGCWVLIEILDRLAERYLLSPYITDAAFWGLYSLIPAVLLVAWSHGKPGRDRATTAEKVGVPINLIATIGLLVTVFGGKDLGATASMISIANEEGVQETHYIPSESFRRRMTVFFFDNDSGDPQLDWLQYGVTELLVQDLQQNPFVLATSPWANFGDGFYMRMKQAGFSDGLNVPLSLMREIASDANRQYFVEGGIDRVAGEYEITVRVWETLSLKQVAELKKSDRDLYRTIDALSVDLRDALDVPRGSARMAEDLPLAETYGEMEAALQQYIAGLNARLFDNDLEASNGYFDAALKRDPGFVMAWYSKAINLIDAGDLQSAQEAISQAQKLQYRLPAVDRALLKGLQYRLSGQQEKLLAYLRLEVRLRDDAASHYRLAIMLMVTGELEEARQNLQSALDKDPLNVAIYRHLSLLERATGNMDSAVGLARKYREEKPEDFEAQQLLGDLLRDSGELDEAQEHYLQASLLGDQPVEPMLRMVDIALRKGDVNEARDLLLQAEMAAESLAEKAEVRKAAARIEFKLGRIPAGIEQLYLQEDYLVQFQPPLAIALEIYQPMVRAHCSLGDPDSAQQALEIALGMVAPPLDKFFGFSEADILIERGDLDGAEAANRKGAEVIEEFRLEDMKFVVEMIKGYILRLRGDYAGSVAAFRAALEHIGHSVLDEGELYRELPDLNAELAHSLVLAGDLDGAEKALTEGFRLDPSEPLLWVNKARFQFASGLPRLALASVNYALAIWKDADPDYRELIEARRLEQEINQSLSGANFD